MKNIQGTEKDLVLFNEDGVKIYEYYKDSDKFSAEYTYDSNGKVLTHKDSMGLRRGFDKIYTEEEIEFIKRAVQQYWDDWNEEDPDNQNDLKLTKQILEK
jgi:YD repeat-containing protein